MDSNVIVVAIVVVGFVVIFGIVHQYRMEYDSKKKKITFIPKKED